MFIYLAHLLRLELRMDYKALLNIFPCVSLLYSAWRLLLCYSMQLLVTLVSSLRIMAFSFMKCLSLTCVCVCMCMKGLQGISISTCPRGTCESAPLCQHHLCRVSLCASECQHPCVGKRPTRTPSLGETRLAGSSASPQWQSRPLGQGGWGILWP